MKKITLLLIALMCFTFGQSQSLPFNFEASQPFVGDSGAAVSDVDDGSGSNQVLQISGDGSQWDNAQVTFAEPLDLSNSALNTIKFRMRSLDAANESEVNEHLLKFEIPTSGGTTEKTFTTTGTGWNDIEVDMDLGNIVPPNSYGKMVIMVDWGGGPTTALDRDYYVDDISIGATTAGTDATLSDLQVDAVTISGFDAGTTSYTYAVANGVTIVPTVTATKNDAGASVAITPASGIPGDTTVEVTAANGTTLQTYTVSFIYPVELPFDFTGTLHNWTSGDGAAISNGAGSDVLEIVGAVNAWDNASVTFTTPIDLSDDANNTLRFTIQSTTAAPGEVHQHGVSFQGGGGSLEANFQTVGQTVKNVELDFDSGLGTRERLHIFVDTGDLGGIAASPNENGTDTQGLSGTYIIDNITLGANILSVDDFVVNKLNIYPNPTQSNWNMSTQNQKIKAVEVFDVLGKKVLSLEPNTNDVVIDGANLNKGLYFAQIKMQNSIKSIKLIKK